MTPLVVRIDGLTVVLQSRQELKLSNDERYKWAAAYKAAVLSAAGPTLHSDVDKDLPSQLPRLDGTKQKALLDALLRSAQVSISDVRIRYEEDTAAGIAALEFRMDYLRLRCKREQTIPRLLSLILRRHKSAQDQTCKLTLDIGITAEWIANGSCATEAILKPLAVRSELRFDLRWPTLTGLSRRDPPRLSLSGTVNVTEIALVFPSTAIEFVIRAARSCMHVLHYARYHDLRPQGNIKQTGSRAWWKYAVQAVARDVRKRHRYPFLAAAKLEYETLLKESGLVIKPQSNKKPDASTARLRLLEEVLELSWLLDVRSRLQRETANFQARAKNGKHLSTTNSQLQDSGGGPLGLEQVEIEGGIRFSLTSIGVSIETPGRASHGMLSTTLGAITLDVDAEIVRAVGGLNSRGTVGARWLLRSNLSLQSFDIFYSSRREGSLVNLVHSGRSQEVATPRSRFSGEGRSALPPAIQMTANCETVQQLAPILDLAVCNGAPLQIVVDLNLIEMVAPLFNLFAATPPASFTEDKWLTACMDCHHRTFDMAVNTTVAEEETRSQALRNKARSSIEEVNIAMQLDIIAPISCTCLVTSPWRITDAGDGFPNLGVPILQIPRIHAGFSTHPENGKHIDMWIYMEAAALWAKESKLLQLLKKSPDSPLTNRKREAMNGVDPGATLQPASPRLFSGALERAANFVTNWNSEEDVVKSRNQRWPVQAGHLSSNARMRHSPHSPPPPLEFPSFDELCSYSDIEPLIEQMAISFRVQCDASFLSEEDTVGINLDGCLPPVRVHIWPGILSDIDFLVRDTVRLTQSFVGVQSNPHRAINSMQESHPRRTFLFSSLPSIRIRVHFPTVILAFKFDPQLHVQVEEAANEIFDALGSTCDVQNARRDLLLVLKGLDVSSSFKDGSEQCNVVAQLESLELLDCRPGVPSRRACSKL